jgi:dye decolorizing peroxidase
LISRRQAILGTLATAGAAGALTAVTGVAAAEAYKQGFAEAEELATTALVKNQARWSGKHQGGIEAPAQAHANFIAYDINPGTTKDDMLRWMVLLTDDISRMCAGKPALADPEPDLILGAANLTITVGFGPGLFKKLGLESRMPTGFKAIPGFKIDQLLPEFSDGDVLIQAGADDLQILSHVTRTLMRDSQSFGQVRWVQSGFTNAVGSNQPGATQRNLMGQVDGTDNPEFGSANFAKQVWIEDGPNWAVGGTTMLLRRIEMNLPTWDQLGREQKEEVIGRHLDTGAPIGKKHERDAIDFDAKDENGMPLIAPFAHIRRAASQNLDERFFRRPFNYQQIEPATNELRAGLLWTAYGRDLHKQYVPVQKRLDEFDLLNKWTTPIGSALFAMPRGFKPGEILAEELFS